MKNALQQSIKWSCESEYGYTPERSLPPKRKKKQPYQETANMVVFSYFYEKYRENATKETHSVQLGRYKRSVEAESKLWHLGGLFKLSSLIEDIEIVEILDSESNKETAAKINLTELIILVKDKKGS